MILFLIWITACLEYIFQAWIENTLIPVSRNEGNAKGIFGGYGVWSGNEKKNKESSMQFTPIFSEKTTTIKTATV